MSSQATFSTATEAQGNQFLGSFSSSAEVDSLVENAARGTHTNHFYPTNGLPIDVDICEYFGNLSLPPPKRRKTNKGFVKIGREPYYPRPKRHTETDLSFEEASIRAICEWEKTGKNTIPEDVGDHMVCCLFATKKKCCAEKEAYAQSQPAAPGYLPVSCSGLPALALRCGTHVNLAHNGSACKVNSSKVM
eukprot:TRINITY_DN64751_c0_g1_i2.p1 TRINITY_DN64751_c0_g1~~TRINITY_DN64751_c0_g1_i2.p1  ORF type:complete len:191 (-),score=16.11 TRINITY_DN64751_c0_g1_i2:126-698(-)